MRAVYHMISTIFSAYPAPAAVDPMPARESMLYRATGDWLRRARHVRRGRRGRLAPASVPRAARAGWMI